MFYLSELIGKRAYDSRGNPVARIRDVVAEVVAGETTENGLNTGRWSQLADDEEPVERDVPVVKGLLVSTGASRDTYYLPVEQIASLDRTGARLRSAALDLSPFERRPGEILLRRDLWDNQVVDLNSRRVTRVNDAIITGAKPDPETAEVARWWVRGVDTGILGLLHRIRLARFVRGRKFARPRIVRWQHLDFFGSNVPGGIDLPHKKLANLHPVEIARISDSVSYHQGAEIIASLDDTLAADALEEIVQDRQSDIIEQLSDERAAGILDEMAPDEAADLLKELPDDKALALLEKMDESEAEEVRYLMRFSERSVGAIMTTDFVQLVPEMTVEEVIESNRDIFLSADLIYYMYVVESDETNRLVGIITVRDLLVYDRTTPVADFMMTEFLSVRPGERHEEVARKMAEYNLLALPVVDRDGILLGVVTVDDALDALLPEGWRKRLPKVFS
jgi:CBS domain-containing protein/sporulation protein YlmC with PRC-barrel domain